MPSQSQEYIRAIALIDAANAEDPNRGTGGHEAQRLVIHAQRMRSLSHFGHRADSL